LIKANEIKWVDIYTGNRFRDHLNDRESVSEKLSRIQYYSAKKKGEMVSVKNPDKLG
jgi:hypothetical protein